MARIVLTMKKLTAMEEALTARLAGEIGDDGYDPRDYEDALDWVNEQMRRRLKYSLTGKRAAT